MLVRKFVGWKYDTTKEMFQILIQFLRLDVEMHIGKNCIHKNRSDGKLIAHILFLHVNSLIFKLYPYPALQSVV